MKKSNLELLKEERNEYKNIAWESTTGISTLITEMSDDYLLNALRKATQKSIVAQHLEYVSEFQTYNGIHYSAWVRYMYNEYLYRKHEGIIIEENMPANNLSNEDKQEYVSGLEFLDVDYNQSNNGIYQIS